MYNIYIYIYMYIYIYVYIYIYMYTYIYIYINTHPIPTYAGPMSGIALGVTSTPDRTRSDGILGLGLGLGNRLRVWE